MYFILEFSVTCSLCLQRLKRTGKIKWHLLPLNFSQLRNNNVSYGNKWERAYIFYPPTPLLLHLCFFILLFLGQSLWVFLRVLQQRFCKCVGVFQTVGTGQSHTIKKESVWNAVTVLEGKGEKNHLKEALRKDEALWDREGKAVTWGGKGLFIYFTQSSASTQKCTNESQQFSHLNAMKVFDSEAV